MTAPFDENNLKDVIAKRARTELGELESDREAAVEALRSWLLEQKTWLCSPTDSQFLLAFLRHRKFSQKAAKERIIEYWKLRSQYPTFCANIDCASDDLQAALKTGFFVPLPNLDKDGCLVLLVRIGILDPKKAKKMMKVLPRVLFAMMDCRLRSDWFQICGFKVVQDYTNFTVQHLVKLEAEFGDVSKVFVNGYPIRINQIIYYNVGALFEMVFAIIKRIISEKMRNRVSVHTSLQTVYDLVDKSVFPEEYLPDEYEGPNAGSVDSILEKFSDELKENVNHDYVAKLSSKQYYCKPDLMPNDAVPTESFRSLQL